MLRPRTRVSILVAAVCASLITIFLLISSGDSLDEDTISITVSQRDMKSLIPFSPVSTVITIHRVYFDDRKKTDGHDNQTVFFIDAEWSIYRRNLIVGCGVGDRIAKKYKVRKPAEWYWVKGYLRKNPFKYEHLYVDCYDMPAKNGDRAFLLYKPKCSSEKIIVVDSDRPGVIFPEPRVTPQLTDGYDITIVSCIKANSHIAPFLGEILHYQKAIGVDHISLITLSSYIKDGGLKNLLIEHPNVIDYFIKGYITADVWKQWYNETDEAHEIRLWIESIRKVACSYHYRGTYDYAMPIDTDDFFTPRVPGQTNIKYYLMKYCYQGKIGSCMLNWITYYPDYCGLNDIPTDGNVTKALKSHEHFIQHAPKSIHKTSMLIDATFHDARPRGNDPNLMPSGDLLVEVPHTICAISHIRRFAVPRNKKCSET